MKKTAVIVLIGDIVGSRDLDERSQIQRKLKRIFTLIKRKRSFLLSPYTITLGDEFQAVYGRAEYLFVDILNILSSIYPVKARFAIGIGGLKTPINRAQAIGMDGPAFYNARKGIEELKKSDFLFRIESKEPPGLDLSNNVLSLLSHISTNWGENRFLILTSLLQDKPVSGIARKLGMSRVGVYKNINAGALNIIVDLIRQIEHEMDLAVSECR